MTHIIPENDDHPHDRTTTCSCGPRVDRCNNSILVVHNSYDMREVLEEANFILGNKVVNPEKRWALYEE